MKKTVFLLAAIASILFVSGLVFAHEDINKYPKCKYNGMDREKFAYSRMLIEYEDGTKVGTGSFYCTAVDLTINFRKKVKSLKVGDYATKTLIDTKKAYWVIGGDVKGVMTKNPKWAFAKKEDAQSFIKEHGGELATYETALKTTNDDMIDDTQYLHDSDPRYRQETRHETMKNTGDHGASQHQH